MTPPITRVTCIMKASTLSAQNPTQIPPQPILLRGSSLGQV